MVGFIHEEFVRDYVLSRNISFQVVDAEFDKDQGWGIPSETEDQFFCSFLSMFHYQKQGAKINLQTHWEVPKCRSLDNSAVDKSKTDSPSLSNTDSLRDKLSATNHQNLLFQDTLENGLGIFGSSQVQNSLRPFRKAVVNDSELFHWRDIIEDRFGSEYDDLLNRSDLQLNVHNAIRSFLNRSLLPAGLEPSKCFIYFSDDSDSEEDDSDAQQDYGIPSILKDEFELWFMTQAENAFAPSSFEERDIEDEDIDDELFVHKSGLKNV